MPSRYFISPWSSTATYKRYDVVGANPYFYASKDQPAGYNPSGIYNYTIGQYSRTDDLVTLTYTHSGGPAFGVGDIVRITASAVNYSGMIVNGGSGTIQYIHPGPGIGTTVTAGTINCGTPGWTSGFAFIPDYTSDFPSENDAIVTQLGNGYTQRMSKGLNTFNETPSLVYRNIDGRQMKAIVHFVQDSDGVRPVEILLNDPFLNNQPNQKYTLSKVSERPVSFGRYDVAVAVTRVFDL